MQRFDRRTPRFAILSLVYVLVSVAIIACYPESLLSQMATSQFPTPGSFIVAYILFGIGLRLLYRNDRIEFDGDRLRKFDLFNRKQFDADVRQIRLVRSRKYELQIKSPSQNLLVCKSIRNYGRLVWHLEGFPKLADLHFESERIYRYNKGSYAIWYLGFPVAVIFFVLGIAESRSLPLHLTWLACGLVFALVTYIFLLQTRHMRVELNREGLRVYNIFGKEKAFMPASDILDARIIASDGDSTEYICVYSNADAVKIHSGCNDYQELCSLINDLLDRRQSVLAERAQLLPKMG